METQTKRTTWTLANLAECASPDQADGIGFDGQGRTEWTPSAGATFLRSVEVSTLEAIADGWTEDSSSEVADGSVPIYTHALWTTFVDLCAYQEDPSELGAESDDMEKCAGACLYLIADRLALAIADEENADDETDDE